LAHSGPARHQGDIEGEFAQHSGKVVLVATCRYRNNDFGKAFIPLGPLPAEALLRLRLLIAV
jgi:hypothetical protein